VVGIVGTLKTAKPVGMWFKRAGSAVILLGGVGVCEPREFGGTQYAKVVSKSLWGVPPKLNMDYEKRVQTAVRELLTADLLESGHDLGDGGLAVALAECSFGPSQVGAAIDLDADMGPEYLLFHEGPSRILVSTANPERVLAVAKQCGVEALQIGATLEWRVTIRNRNDILIDCRLSELKDLWSSALQDLLHNPVLV
jgi:phosphoribosylformylglycinamidine synthase